MFLYSITVCGWRILLALSNIPPYLINGDLLKKANLLLLPSTVFLLTKSLSNLESVFSKQ